MVILPSSSQTHVTAAWYWKALPTRTLAFERHKCSPTHKPCKEYIKVMCCGNASGKHKPELAIGKAKKPGSFKGI
jgi:hypothetical protein